MIKKKKTKSLRLWNIISIIIIILFIISNIYLHNKNNYQENRLETLETKLEERKRQEEFIEKHKKDLDTIKILKQEILGQQNKLQELSKQLNSFTEILIKNQEKLDKLES